MRKLDVTILGSGTSTGVPVLGCPCEVCASPDPRNDRTRCSALLSFCGRNILIDTATDLRQQMLREEVRHIDAVLYTHTHADHLHGIDDLRTFSNHVREPIPIYADRATLERIRTSFDYIFSDDPEQGYRPKLEMCRINGSFDLFGLYVEPIPLIHGRGNSLGYRVGPFAYLTDCNQIPPQSATRLRDLEILVIDALRFTPHATHFNIAGAIEAARMLGARRTVLTHLSHDVDYGRHAPQLPPGVEFAYDGMRLGLQLP
jgi:phosphoribosyl 1,2-cyclic phosphate phosphodiesterase